MCIYVFKFVTYLIGDICSLHDEAGGDEVSVVSKEVKEKREPRGNNERFAKLRNVHAQDQNPLSDEQKVLEGKAEQGT